MHPPLLVTVAAARAQLPSVYVPATVYCRVCGDPVAMPGPDIHPTCTPA